MIYNVPVNFLILGYFIGVILIAIVLTWVTKKGSNKGKKILTIVLIILCFALSIFIVSPIKVTVNRDSFSFNSLYLKDSFVEDQFDHIELYSSLSSVPYNFKIRTMGIGMPGYLFGFFHVSGFSKSFLVIRNNDPVIIAVSSNNKMYAISTTNEYIESLSRILGVSIK